MPADFNHNYHFRSKDIVLKNLQTILFLPTKTLAIKQ